MAVPGANFGGKRVGSNGLNLRSPRDYVVCSCVRRSFAPVVCVR